MKAKYYIGILSVILLAGFPVKAQIADNGYYGNDDARIVVNNYYDDYDYYFSSRINRFHRSYAVFDYYSPVFTESYWYNFRPNTWGISIYRGGLGFSLGYNFNYPMYYGNDWGYNFGYDYGWYDPFFSSSYYWGYDPLYYNFWYTPVVINIGVRNRWSNHYWGWNGHNNWHNDYSWNNRYSPVYNTYNNYYENYPSTRYSSADNTSRRRPTNSIQTNNGNVSGREISNGAPSQTDAAKNRSRDKSNNGLHMGETRRNANPTVSRGQGENPNNGNGVNQGNVNNGTRRSTEVRNNNGKNNSNGNINNIDRNTNNINNTNRNNNKTNNSGNNVNRGNQNQVRTNNGTDRQTVNPSNGQVNRRSATVSKSRSSSRSESKASTSSSREKSRRK